MYARCQSFQYLIGLAEILLWPSAVTRVIQYLHGAPHRLTVDTPSVCFIGSGDGGGETVDILRRIERSLFGRQE